MLERRVECAQIRRKEAAFDGKLEQAMAKDTKYALAGDRELTAEQKREIDAFWQKYSFAFTPPYATFQAYMNRTGKFDPRYIPYGVQHYCLDDHLKDRNFTRAFREKAYLHKTYPGIKQPAVVCRRIEGVYVDAQYERITRERAAELCVGALARTEIVFKPSGRCGGAGVVFLKDGDASAVLAQMDRIPDTLVVQEAVRQHPQMAALNPGTVNCVRLTTYFKDGEVIPLAALVKIGSASARVDNYKYGGHLLGLSLDGRALPYALDVKLNRVQVLPTGIDLSGGMQIPGFANVLETAKRAHLHTPQGRMISWDIAIDEQSEAVVIEANFSGDLRMHHAVTGPVFGEMTEAFLDEYLAGKFCRERCNEDFDFREFFDHVEITRYGGWKRRVNVPERIHGKPVTVIGREAFKGCALVRAVSLPATVKYILWDAFDGCSALEAISAAGTFAGIADRAFVGTKLTAADKQALRAKIVRGDAQ